MHACAAACAARPTLSLLTTHIHTHTKHTHTHPCPPAVTPGVGLPDQGVRAHARGPRAQHQRRRLPPRAARDPHGQRGRLRQDVALDHVQVRARARATRSLHLRPSRATPLDACVPRAPRATRHAGSRTRSTMAWSACGPLARCAAATTWRLASTRAWSWPRLVRGTGCGLRAWACMCGAGWGGCL
jgi:hypothetical protein